MLHPLIRGVVPLQLFYISLIFHTVCLYFCSHLCVFQGNRIVMCTIVCNGTDIIPLCISVFDFIENPNCFHKAVILNEIQGCLQVNAILILSAAGFCMEIGERTVRIMAFIHNLLICLLHLLEFFFVFRSVRSCLLYTSPSPRDLG